MSRQTRFARAFEPWIAEWAEAGLSGTQERVMLLLAANMERNGKGQFESWRPRTEMAEILGVSEFTVRDAIQALRRKGMIVKSGYSHRGKAQKYILMPCGKGYPPRQPINEKGSAEALRKGSVSHSQRVSATANPTRPLEGACAAPSSEGRPGAREIDYGAMSAERNRGIV